MGYADAGYLSDPTRGKSQTGYVFIMNGAALSWRLSRQGIAATTSNHAELLALHEASREATWLRRLRKTISTLVHLPVSTAPLRIYEDNAACIAQHKKGFIKGDRTKHIVPKFFFTAELQHRKIDVVPIASSDNVADILTKSLPSSIHWKHVAGLGLHRRSSLAS